MLTYRNPSADRRVSRERIRDYGINSIGFCEGVRVTSVEGSDLSIDNSFW
jgi:hypothetical protein